MGEVLTPGGDPSWNVPTIVSVGTPPTPELDELLPPASSSSSISPAPQGPVNSLVNLYFLLLAVVIGLGVILYFVLHRRRKDKRARSRNVQQDALARDIEGWAGRRRWIYGGRGAGPDDAALQPEEGLDERGEAPPPYKRTQHSEDSDGVGETSTRGEHDPEYPEPQPPDDDSANELAIPLRTLSRTHQMPPAYIH